MNYIWELAINAVNRDMDPDTVFYRCGRPFSGYMELSFSEMNETEISTEVEINPFYRYHSIFKELFHPDFDEGVEVVDTVHDLAIHHLKDIDVLMGMGRREYYIRFVIGDMHGGRFGEYVRENIHVLTRGEQKIVADNLLSLYTTAECIHLLKDTIGKVFTNSYILLNTEEKDEIVCFLRTRETAEKTAKMEFIKYLFLPFKCDVLIYWDRMFGIIGVPDLMEMGGIMNY